MPGMKKKGAKKPMKKGATPGAMSYNQARRVIMNRGGAPKELIASLKRKYPEEFQMNYGGGTKKAVGMRRGGKTAYGKRKKKK